MLIGLSISLTILLPREVRNGNFRGDTGHFTPLLPPTRGVDSRCY